MNDSIEDRLRRARPARLPSGFRERLYMAEPAAFSEVAPYKGRRGFGWAAAGALAVVASVCIGLFSPLQPSSPTAPAVAKSQIFRPIKGDRYLVSASEMGIFAPAPDRPYRLVQCIWMEDEAYRGADGISTVRVQRARRQIVPVALETF